MNYARTMQLAEYSAIRPACNEKTEVGLHSAVAAMLRFCAGAKTLVCGR